MIDYIQLCRTSATSASREREVAHITALAKQTAKLTGAHILMPSQVNKDGDVRESMAVEQDADTLIKIEKLPGAASGGGSGNAYGGGGRMAAARGHGRRAFHSGGMEADPGTAPCQDRAEEEELQSQVRDLFFKKVRDGERFKRVRVRLMPGLFRFNRHY